ncbi:MAG: cobyric acid synthase [Clostridium sp.]
MKDKIMIIGTKEKVGKSLISICIGKFLKEKSIKVIPFKTFDIDNKAITIGDDLKVGYNESLKMDALDYEKNVFSNPILINKVNGKAKVYVNGRSYAKAEEFDFKRLREDFVEFMDNGFEEIKEEGFTLIEGFGECLEYVEREEEFLNFNFAKKVQSDIILVTDFEDNNTFANIYGTLSLITKEDRKRIKGIIINNYDGDMEYLNKGLSKLEKRLKVPFLGVMPNINTDILSADDYGKNYRFDKKGDLIIGVVKTPGLSHVSDFYPFEDEKEVKMTLIEKPDHIDDVDFIVLPGSKNTLKDLAFLKKTGLDKKIIEGAENGKTVMGICGGFQILGEEIEDLYSIENKGTKEKGLGLIPLKTTYDFVNKTTIAKGNVCNMTNSLKSLSGIKLYGYESIEGDSDMLEGSEAFMIDKMNNVIGLSNKEGNVFGTFMHGVFESKEFRKGLLKILKEKHGVVTSNKNLEEESFKDYKERRFTEFYNIFKENIDLEKLNKVLNGEEI